MTQSRLYIALLAAALAAQTTQAAEAPEWELIGQYCSDCHNLDDYSGGLAFDLLSPATIPQEAATWEVPATCPCSG